MDRILIADQENKIMRLAAEKLERAGYGVLCTTLDQSEILRAKADLIILYAHGDLFDALREPLRARILVIFPHPNSYLEKYLRMNGVYCISVLDTVDIVEIVSRVLSLP